jgi:hypothetical protein
MMLFLKKFLILLACMVFLNGCITVVFEPYLGGDHTVTASKSGEENVHSPSGKDQKK